jgi:hypothetical protein
MMYRFAAFLVAKLVDGVFQGIDAGRGFSNLLAR